MIIINCSLAEHELIASLNRLDHHLVRADRAHKAEHFVQTLSKLGGIAFLFFWLDDFVYFFADVFKLDLRSVQVADTVNQKFLLPLIQLFVTVVIRCSDLTV